MKPADTDNAQPRYLIVGAGPAGLAQARAFLRHGMAFDTVERHHTVGGIWDITRDDSPIYDSAHFISSKTQSAYFDYPMPDSYPDYPGHQQLFAYLNGFADEFGLREHIEFNISVDHAVWNEDHWDVALSNGDKRTYAGVVCASGTQWIPNMPSIPGTFAGRLMHSVEYRSLDAFRGKRVLVIGAGNSGVDIACDAARGADTAVISMRRGYHVVPKHIFGMPADVFASTGPHLPMKAAQWIFPKLLRVLHGKPQRYGLPKPDHKLFETHPIVNSQILHYLSHGDLCVKPDVSGFDGNTVVFSDGTKQDFDVVVMATGFHTRVPYLDESYFEWKGNRPQLYMRLANPTHPTLFAMGFTEGDGGAYELFDEMADLVANAATTFATGGPAAARWMQQMRTDQPDLQGGVKHVDSDRHQSYLHLVPYRHHYKSIYKKFGWTPVRTGSFASLRRSKAPAA